MKRRMGDLEERAGRRESAGLSASANEGSPSIAYRSVAGLVLACGLMLGGLAGARPAAAEPLYSFQIGLLGGAGGSLDVDPGDGFGNTTVQVSVGVPTEPGTIVTLRAGRVQFDAEKPFGSMTGAEMQYLNIAGEYRFFEGYYQSGMFLGLGAYRLEGDRLDGRAASDESVGLAFGVTADFAISRRLTFSLELAGHYVDFDEAQLFATGLVGLQVRF